MGREILLVSAISVPLAIIVTLWVCRYLHYIPDKVARGIVYIVLLGVGGFLVVGSLM